MHVVGANDGHAQQGLILAPLCDSRVFQTIVYEGRHECLRKDETLQRVADCMQTAVARSIYLQLAVIRFTWELVETEAGNSCFYYLF